jgi:acyl carrier protein
MREKIYSSDYLSPQTRAKKIEMTADKQIFYRKLEKLLKVPSGSLKGADTLNSFESWDSLTILEFIALADKDYQCNVQPGDIAACRTVGDLSDLTLAHSSPPA